MSVARGNMPHHSCIFRRCRQRMKVRVPMRSSIVVQHSARHRARTEFTFAHCAARSAVRAWLPYSASSRCTRAAMYATMLGGMGVPGGQSMLCCDPSCTCAKQQRREAHTQQSGDGRTASSGTHHPRRARPKECNAIRFCQPVITMCNRIDYHTQAQQMHTSGIGAAFHVTAQPLATGARSAPTHPRPRACA